MSQANHNHKHTTQYTTDGIFHNHLFARSIRAQPYPTSPAGTASEVQPVLFLRVSEGGMIRFEALIEHKSVNSSFSCPSSD
jgi:hypothetical protein